MTRRTSFLRTTGSADPPRASPHRRLPVSDCGSSPIFGARPVPVRFDPNITGANAYRTSRTLRLTGGTHPKRDDACPTRIPTCRACNPRPESLESANRLAHDQIARWADRIADGRDEFPADLVEPDRSALADAVRLRLRDRLVRLVARAIAARLARRDTPATQE